MTHSNIEIKIGTKTLENLTAFLAREQAGSVILVADQNTYAVLGKKVEQRLIDQRFEVKLVLLTGDEIHPDEKTMVQVLLPAGLNDRYYIVVGSGTITDVVRFVSYRAKMKFISLPTATSMDGYTSNGSSLTIGGLKQTVYSRPPAAIFPDLATLYEAPRPLIAAGFGDMLAKYTTLPEWKMANMLVSEEFSASIAERVQTAADRNVGAIERVDEDWQGSIQTLMDVLIESGLCMLDFGNSRPASGAEHSISHYWEYRLLRENRPAVFHGTKVGIATILTAKLYRELRKMDRRQAADSIRNASPLDHASEVEQIQRGYDDISDQIKRVQENFLEMVRAHRGQMQDKILENWDSILEYAHTVPEPEEFERLLRKAGGPIKPEEINLSRSEVEAALLYGFYIRSRFSLFHLLKFLGVNPMDWLER